MIPLTFENCQIRVVTIDGEPWFVAKDVASALGYANTNKAVKDHCRSATSWRDLRANAELPPGVTGLDPQTKLIPESDLYSLVMKSELPSAERFQRWVTGDVLPSIRKTGSYSVNPQQKLPKFTNESLIEFEIKRQAAKDLCEQLRMSDASYVRMYSSLLEEIGTGTKFVPSYVSEPQVKALTDLLKLHGMKLSAKAANPVLIDMGILEEKERRSSNGSTKKFKSLTQKGLDFGKNEVSPNNPRESQPLYFEDKFPELLKMLKEHMGMEPMTAEDLF